MFYCYTGCDSFDIYTLIIKVAEIQWNEKYDLNQAVRWIARRFGIAGVVEGEEQTQQLEDWKIFHSYEKRKDQEITNINFIELKKYNDSILNKFNYKVLIKPWLDEDINQFALNKAKIGYYPGQNQITIPHYDKNDNFVGLRGRTLSAEEAEKYGKYRPIKIGKNQYNHPLGLNLYGLNWAKDNIKRIKKTVIVESEKSVLKYISYFGEENNICVACCGSHVSPYQVELLKEAGAQEIIIAMDRQFKQINDDEFKHLTKSLIKLNNKFKNYITISFIFDKNMITDYKDSPLDKGKEIFLKLFKERVFL